jgi:glyceraldehyde 3-phosphate dehydrogenase
MKASCVLLAATPALAFPMAGKQTVGSLAKAQAYSPNAVFGAPAALENVAVDASFLGEPSAMQDAQAENFAFQAQEAQAPPTGWVEEFAAPSLNLQQAQYPNSEQMQPEMQALANPAVATNTGAAADTGSSGWQAAVWASLVSMGGLVGVLAGRHLYKNKAEQQGYGMASGVSSLNGQEPLLASSVNSSVVTQQAPTAKRMPAPVAFPVGAPPKLGGGYGYQPQKTAANRMFGQHQQAARQTMALAATPAGAAGDKTPVPCAINGFGRIGRLVARIMCQNPEIDLKLINSSASVEYMAYQMKYDSIHGRYNGTIEVGDDETLIVDGKEIKVSHTRDPAEIPFAKYGADYVCESTGAFLTGEKVAPHFQAGAKKIVFSAPAKDESPTIVMGVNQNEYQPEWKAVSCASCTTNGLAPMVKAINDEYGIEEALMTTVHAMTATQKVVDSSSTKDWRGGRYASGNIIPSSTGAAKAVTKVIPELQGKLTGMAFRVPTGDVSVVDLTARLKTETTYEDICNTIKKKADGEMKGYLGYCDEPLVSTDFESEPISSVFDAGAGIMLNPKFVKLIAWYDNEWGYSNRVVDLMVHMARQDKVHAELQSKA